MDVVKLPKKVRMVCYEIMDGKEEALDTLESFADKYPHQVAAVKAEVAYFNLDYEKALALDLTILPWLEEWHYSNVSDEHMTAMTVAAIRASRDPVGSSCDGDAAPRNHSIVRTGLVRRCTWPNSSAAGTRPTHSHT